MLLKKCWVDPNLAGGERGGTRRSDSDTRLQPFLFGFERKITKGVCGNVCGNRRPSESGLIGTKTPTIR